MTVSSPPAFAERLLKALVPDGIVGESIVGDAREEYHETLERTGRVRAWVQYSVHVLFIGLRYTTWVPGRGPRQTQVTPSMSATRYGESMNNFVQDVRYALRTLARVPGFTIAVVVTLALGIGANTAIFSVVRAVLLQPLPYPSPDQLVTLWSQEDWPYGTNVPEYLDLRDRNRTLEDIAVYTVFGQNLTSNDTEPVRVNGIVATGGLFRILGVGPVLGRVIADEDDAPGKNAVVLLAHGFWQRQFGGDSAVVGQTVLLDGAQFAVIGVMPPTFAFPNETVDMWVPAGINPATRVGRGGHGLQSVARLRPGATVDQASQDMERISRAMHQENPDAYPEQFRSGWTVRMEPLHDSIVGDVRPALLVLLGAVGLVLLIACVNVANLLLAWGTAREREVAVRAALGASGGRLMRQLLTESTLLSLLGGLAGLGLAVLGLGWLVRFGPSDIPRLTGIGLDAGALGFALAASVFTGVLCGIAPAVYAVRTDLQRSLKQGDRGTSGGRGEYLRRGLVALEVAVTLVLLIGAGLLIQSLSNLHHVDAGFHTDDVLTFHVSLPRARYQTRESQVAFYGRLVSEVNGLPGVTGAGAISELPLAEDFSAAVMAEDMPPNHPSRPHGLVGLASPRSVTAGYFRAMGLTLLEGRLFASSDGAAAPRVAIVSDEFARTAWPNGGTVIGRRVAFPTNARWSTVVGVVKDTREEAGNLASQRYKDAYFPLEQLPSRDMYITIKADGNPLGLVDAVRAKVASFDPSLPVYELQLMESVVNRATARPRFNARLMTIFAAIALALGGVGIYGVVSYAVGRRVREVGIRMTLGARPGTVLWNVVKRGMQPVLLGFVIGVPGVLAVTRLLRGLLFGVSPTDWQTYGAVSAILVGVSLLACYVPARRAMRVDPVRALRIE